MTLSHITESEIVANWPKDEPVRVSICCITYKQEQYISQTIDSFLMQKTTFPFEIIIGEDCGGDGTLAILDEYQSRYPNLIKVITAEKNVGANANLLRVFGAAKGEYIAICEGDDYWIDEFKIQKQYNALVNNKDSHLCFTAAQRLTSNNELKIICSHNKSKFSSSEIIRGGGSFVVTATIMMNKIVVSLLPEWFKDAHIGDFYLQILSSRNDGALYLSDVTAVYRSDANNSYSSSRKKLAKEKIINDISKLINNLDNLNDFHILKADLDHAKAQHEYISAFEALKSEHFDLFKKLINDSWSRSKNINKLQVFLYFLQCWPKLTLGLLKLKKS